MDSSTKKFNLVLIFSTLLFPFVIGFTCFYPNGDIASNYTACSPNGDGSCCVDGEICTSLGYCVSNTRGYIYRGACTDQEWGNPSCPDYCLDNTNFGNSPAVNVIACNAAAAGGTWCCAYDGNCCDSTTYVPFFGTLFAEPASSSTASSPAIVTTSGTYSQTTSPSGAVTTTTPEPQNSVTPTSTAQKNNKTGAIVGAAVGAPLGLAAVASMLLFFVERRKRQKLESEKLKGPPVPEKPSYHAFGSKGSSAQYTSTAGLQHPVEKSAVKSPQELHYPTRWNFRQRYELSATRTHELDSTTHSHAQATRLNVI